ncbi:endonuclease/exonuclease/phosphatase family protein [Pedobacter sp.]|nr:endonuclease/exonuclease/phosphatase family protein [Candidatus Saccharibacteria bacterium]
MKITTLNLEGFTDWEARKPNIIAYLKDAAPDVILFQEAVFIPEISIYNQVQLLNETLAYPFEHSAITRLQTSVVYETFREGLACLSKLPVIKTDDIILKKASQDKHNRIIQCIDVVIDGKIVKLANVHFSLTDTIDFASAHLSETLSIFAARGEERIIAGDFNLNHLESTAELWQERYVASTRFSYTSFPSLNKSIDYVLVPKRYEFTSLAASADGLSDHRALTVDIKT